MLLKLHLFLRIKCAICLESSFNKQIVVKITKFDLRHKNIIIDFNGVGIRIYLPEKVIIHRGREAELNIIFKGR